MRGSQYSNFFIATFIGTFAIVILLEESVEGGVLGGWQTCGNETTGFNSVFPDIIRQFTKNRGKCSTDFDCKNNIKDTKCSGRCRNQCSFGSTTGVTDLNGTFHEQEFREFMNKFANFTRKENLTLEFLDCAAKGNFTYENDCSTFDGFVHCVIHKYEEVCNTPANKTKPVLTSKETKAT